MDFAASTGCLDAVKWLHGNRNEGCTTRAMRGAAVNGHFEVLLFLRANRTEGCALNTMDDSETCLDSLEIGQCLYEKDLDAGDVNGLTPDDSSLMPGVLDYALLG